MKRYKLIVERNQDGYWGQFVEYPTVFTHGETIDQIIEHAHEALDLFFEGSDKASRKFEVFLMMDLVHFFKINDFINITSLAKRSGINASLLRQYAKGIKYPSLKQVARIEQAVRQIGAELINTQLIDKQIPLSH